MYSLLVSHVAEKQTAGSFELERDRFLEYTADKITIPLRGLSNEAIGCLCSWPCLLMQEGRAQEIARVVEVSEVAATGKEITITIRPATKPLEITNNQLWKLRTDLDIAEFEFSRNHWAVKERDLFAVLEKAGVRVKAGLREQFTAKPLPVISRSTMIGIRDVIAEWGHSKIDDLLLEAGIDALRAGREAGGRRARADAILKFTVDNPEAVTAENSLFSQFLLLQTKKSAQAGSALPQDQERASSDRSATNGSSGAESENRSPNRVFVVHGRNESARDEVVTFLGSNGLQGIVLHEQPNMGRHLLTKFIGEAELVTFAVVLMTDDDMGGVKGGSLAPRARQNVILELGYFLAHLGQAKVCALISPGLETPSDFDGIVYIKMSSDGKWQKELLRELRAAKMPVT